MQLYVYMYVSLFGYVYMSIGAIEGLKHQSPWSWSNRKLWVLGIEFGTLKD